MAEKTVFGLDLIIDDLLVETVDRCMELKGGKS